MTEPSNPLEYRIPQWSVKQFRGVTLMYVLRSNPVTAPPWEEQWADLSVRIPEGDVWIRLPAITDASKVLEQCELAMQAKEIVAVGIVQERERLLMSPVLWWSCYGVQEIDKRM